VEAISSLALLFAKITDRSEDINGPEFSGIPGSGIVLDMLSYFRGWLL
jgi:hypothetical protein